MAIVVRKPLRAMPPRKPSRLWAWAAAFVAWVGRAEPIYGMAGPIFERDLRVSGRRRRNYVLRFVYLGVLGWFVAMGWLSTVTLPALFGGFGTKHIPDTSWAGIALATTIIWFQFLVLPLLAVVMLSTSISDEVRRRTLGVLMTAPINSVHIVMGKFLGKMVQLILLLAISVPMLLVVRVLGGVTWEYVLAGTCLTLALIMLAGAMGLYFSIGGRAVPLVILKAIGALNILFLLVPLVIASSAGGGSTADVILAVTNPFAQLMDATTAMSGARPAGAAVHWTINFLLMLGLTAAILAVSTLRVRRAALRQLVGSEGGGWRGRGGGGRIRRVRGSPVAWKEWRSRIYRRPVRGVIGTGLLLGVLVATYFVVGAGSSWAVFDAVDTHLTYVFILIIYGVLYTAVVASTSVTAEKESGTWPILLVTPLDDPAIVYGKAVGAMMRSVPGWLPLVFHMTLMTVLGYMHPAALPLVMVTAFSSAAILTGSGVLLGVLFRRTVAAAVGNIIFSFVLWVMLPMMSATFLAMFIFMGARDILALAALLHPLFQAWLVLSGTAGSAMAGRSLADMQFQLFPDPSLGHVGVIGAAVAVLVPAAFYLAAAWMFGHWACGRVRKSAM